MHILKFERLRCIASAAFAGIVCILFNNVAYAEKYTFRIEPSYPPERMQEIYKPLMAYLAKSTGQQFVLDSAKNYHFYWRDLQNTAKTDFAFDEAHFTAFR